MIIAENSFSQAVEKFQDFLAENNLPTEILWVFKEDVFCKNTEIYETTFCLKLPLSRENIILIEKQFEIGRQKKLGMCLSAFALCEDKICCHIVIPSDEEDSELLRMSPEYLKFSYVKDMTVAKVINSNLKWAFFKIFPFKYKQGNFLVYLQSKKDLQFSNI
ncbi:MAG: hypothetical protein ABIP06_09605 [Pyrinomonadaceae bacterium]